MMSAPAIGVGLRPAGPAKWWPNNTQFAADFIGRRFMSRQRSCTFEEAVAFTRPSPATAMSAQGQCLAFGPDVARFTANGFLMEAEATNVLRRSSGLSDAGAWSAESYAATTGKTRNFGALVLEECAVTSPAAFPKFRSLDTLSLANGEYGVVSFYAMAGPASPLRTHVSDGTGNTATNWSVGSGVFSKAGIIENNPGITRHVSDGMEHVGHGLYRLWTVFRNVSGSARSYQTVPHIQGTSGVPGMASACWMGGHQLEKGRWPTSLVLTSGASATRAADSVSISAFAAGLGSAPSVALSARWLGEHTERSWLLSLDDASERNVIGVYADGAGGSLGQLVTVDGAVQLEETLEAPSLSRGDHIAFALRAATGDFHAVVRRNRADPTYGIHSLLDIPPVTQIRIGSGQGAGARAAMCVERLMSGDGWSNSALAGYASSLASV